MSERAHQPEVVIVGGGPAGTVTALYLQQYNICSTIIEQERFPRFHIGESLTGEVGKSLRELGFEDSMQAEAYPVKYGVRVYNAKGSSAFWVPVMARTTDGQLEESSTWQVRRSTFDKMLFDEAVNRGATRIYGRVLKPLRNENGEVKGVQIQTDQDQKLTIPANVIVDASGPATFLSNSKWTGPKQRGNYTNQVALFTHVTGAQRDTGQDRDNTLIFYRELNHWGWFIPIDNETVSIGIVTPSHHIKESELGINEIFLQELQTLNPELSSRVKDIQLMDDVRAISNYSYHIRDFTGQGFLCVGDSHRFVDPIFSFGVHLAFTEGKMAAQSIADYLKGSTANHQKPFEAYQRRCEQGQDVVQTLIDTFWRHPLKFGYMVHHKFTDDFIDIFAGRIYEEEASAGLRAMYRLLSAG